MGLGGGRKRVKIAHDPNNTAWSRSTTSYGHRLLLSQGWQPGSTLGAADKRHGEHLTAASSSHIRVSLREDNLGLGAKNGSGQGAGECVGLGAFQGLLGRLNGKSDEVLRKEADAREDLQRARYVERMGMMRFMYGGLLVGDELEEKDAKAMMAERSVKVDSCAKSIESADAGLLSDGVDAAFVDSRSRTAKNAHQAEGERPDGSRRTSDGNAVAILTATDVSCSQARIKDKKCKKRRGDDADLHGLAVAARRGSPGGEMETHHSSSEDEKSRKARRKKEKAEKRERKRQKREAKAARRVTASGGGSSAETTTKEVLVVEEDATQSATSMLQAASNTTGRHTSVRSRYIAAKRRAVMDPQALKEILMVKA